MGEILLQGEEYINGFRRYIAKPKHRGRPRNGEAETVSFLQAPTEICSLPPVGISILISDTVWTSVELERVLYDRYETDACGRPIIYKVKSIRNDTICLERTIETYNQTIMVERYIPCAWITSGATGWVTVQDFFERIRKERARREEKKTHNT